MRLYSSFVGCVFLLVLSSVAWGQTITYSFTGEITTIMTNQNNVVPNLDLGDSFSGFLTINSPELNNTPTGNFNMADFNPPSGTTAVLFAELNGLDLLFDVPPVFGGAMVGPRFYTFSLSGDSSGVGGPTTTFAAFNFGVNSLVDTDGSAGITELFPDTLDLSEFELNVFSISGTHVPTGNGISLEGELTSFTAVPEPSGFGIVGMCVLLLSRRRYRQTVV